MPAAGNHFLRIAVLFIVLTLITQSASAATYTNVFSFPGGRRGQSPADKLLFDNSGNIFGVAGASLYELSPKGRERVLSRLPKRTYASSGLIADSSGNLYGTTRTGGGSPNCKYGCGTVYRLAPDGTMTVLHAFEGGTGDGANPNGGLIADANGNLYGTTEFGGNTTNYCGGCGTVYRIAPDGTETLLYLFNGPDGFTPTAGLIFDSGGNLYGTTYSGGAFGPGSVFKLAPDGTESVLFSFMGHLYGAFDGYGPASELVKDGNGNLYGTTVSGGSNTNCYGFASGCGTVFEVFPNGTEKVLYSFQGGEDGAQPWNGLALDGTGNLYGVTFMGGGSSYCYDGCGVVFELTPDGTETLLHAYAGGSDGSEPYASPIIYNGNLYGSVQSGGAHGDGAIFEVMLNSSENHH